MNSNVRIGAISVALVVAVIVGIRGCSGYGEVNQLTYQHAKALYAACNSRQQERLDACAALISEAESSEQISSTEAGYLREIIEVARAEKWEEAQAMARELMTDQADL